MRLSDQIVVVLRADIRGDVLIGTTDDMMGKMGAFDLRRDSKPNPRLLAAAPPDRPHLRPPPANPVDFDGAYEADLPETVGKSAPMVGATLRCKDGTCTFAMGKDSKEVYDKLGSIHPSHYSQAKFALHTQRNTRQMQARRRRTFRRFSTLTQTFTPASIWVTSIHVSRVPTCRG